MLKKVFVLCALSLFVLNCASKKDVKESGQIANVAMEGSEMNQDYSASGSDYMQAGELKSVHFEYDKANITNLGKEILKNNFSWLKDNPGVFIQIEGHCDNRGTIEYNIALGERRAITVKNYLKQLGISESRISTISYGEEKPLDLDDNDQAWAKNRRANFVIISR